MPNWGRQSDWFDWSKTGLSDTVSTQHVQSRIKACTVDISQTPNPEKKATLIKSRFDYYNSMSRRQMGKVKSPSMSEQGSPTT